MTLFSRFASICLLLAVASCSDPTSPRSSVLIGDNLLRLTASASTREIEFGSPVTLRVSLTNEGAETVTLQFGSSCQILPYIHNAGGARVLPAADDGWACLGVLTQLSLDPGQSEVKEYVWKGSSKFRSEPPLPALPRGRYYFTAEVPEYRGEPPRLTLRSEPLELILK
jgi:hypothetical protein